MNEYNFADDGIRVHGRTPGTVTLHFKCCNYRAMFCKHQLHGADRIVCDHCNRTYDPPEP